MMMVMEIATLQQEHHFVEQIFAMRKHDQNRQNINSKSPGRIGVEVQTDQRQAGKRKQTRQNSLAQKGKTHRKQQQKRSGKVTSQIQQRAQLTRHSTST